MTVLLQVTDLEKSFGDKKVLKGLTFSLDKGEVLGLIGKSGAGKSTILKILSSLEKSSSGSFKIEGSLDVSNLIGYSFQHNSFYEELTLQENLNYFGSIYNINKNDIKKRTEDLFRLTDLSLSDLKLKIHNLSGGMKKRFDIVLAMLHNPKLLILDEPTAGLDPMRRKQIMHIIRRIQSEGVTIIISSHLMSDISDVCTKVLVLDNGKKVIMDEPEKIRNELMELEEIELTTTPGNYKKIIPYIKGFNFVHMEERNNKLHIYTPESEILIHYILHVLEHTHESLENIVITEPTLESVFETLKHKSESKIMQDNLQKINHFIYSLLGKKYSKEELSKILKTHKWPSEVTKVLLNKTPKVFRK